MKLSVSVILPGGRYVRAGDELPESELPPHLRVFAAVNAEGSESASESGKAPGQSPHSRVSLRATRVTSPLPGQQTEPAATNTRGKPLANRDRSHVFPDELMDVAHTRSPLLVEMPTASSCFRFRLAVWLFAVTETDSQPERNELCPPSEKHAKPKSSKTRRTSKQ